MAIIIIGTLLTVIGFTPALVFAAIECIAAAAGYDIFIPVTFQTWVACVFLLIVVNPQRPKD